MRLSTLVAIAGILAAATSSHDQPLLAAVKVSYTFSGTCTELNDYVRDTGVKDAEGTHHPAYSGWTTDHYEFAAWIAGKLRTESRTVPKLKCACNDKVYADIQICLSECKVGLGCFTGICDPDGTIDAVCVTATDIKAKKKKGQLVTGTFTPVRLGWKPPRGRSRACLSDKTRWETAVNTHENRHVADGNTIVNETRDKWKTRSFDVCAPTKSEAMAALNKQIDDAMEADIEEMKEEFKKRGDAFHEEERQADRLPIPGPDCSICQ